MKKTVLTLLIFLILIPGIANSHIETGKSLPAYSITSKTTDKTLKKDETLFSFTCFDATNKEIQKPIKYSYNGKEATVNPDSKGKFSLKLKPGKYKFQFFLNSDHEEIYTDSIHGKGKIRTEIRLNFKDALMPIMEDKPVIYLYPSEKTQVSVKLDLKGELLFTYPAYKNGWDVEASPDGTLRQKDQEYSYLFWEGKSEIKKSAVNFEEGFVVNTGNLLNFFEEKLTKMELSSKEKQDFITYWFPRMSSSEKHYIRFMFAAEFDAYAHLEITPKPDNLFRVFMIWDPLEAKQQVSVKEQTIPAINRKGFSVMEWGGTEVSYFTEENN